MKKFDIINEIILIITNKIPEYRYGIKNRSKREIKELLLKKDYDKDFIEEIDDDFCKGFGCAKDIILENVKDVRNKLNKNDSSKVLKEYYVLKDKENDEFFALDHQSGGYPCLTKDLTDAYKFNNLNEFEKFKNDRYYKSFEKELKNCKIVKIVITMKE